MKRVLVVDDSPMARDAFPDIISLIAPNEFEFITAKDGQEALEIIISKSSSEPLYALITDFNMPRMTGGELVREIIKREISINKIVIISGEVENQFSVDDILMSNKHIMFKLKPCHFEEIVKFIKE